MPTNDSDHSLASKSVVAEPAPELPQGSKIDRYVVLEVLGRGGMGVVYKAYDPELNRGVALKLIRTQQEGRGSVGSARLLREAQALGQLNHPNVVSVHDVGAFGDSVFVAMELVKGRTLKAWHKESKPTTTEVLEVMRAAGRGLAAAHNAGLIHRDFKPDNVIVGEDGRVRVIDFGLARAGDAGPSAAVVDQIDLEEFQVVETQAATRVRDKQAPRVDGSRETPLSSGSKDLLSSPVTRAGSIVGTLLYMAPEQHLGVRVDARADQFSFCAVLYEVLYGRRVFAGGSLQEIAKQVRYGRVRPPPAESDVPKRLQDIVMRGLTKRLSARFPSMEALLKELGHDPEEARRQRQAARRRKMLVLGSVALAVCGPIGAWYGIKYQRARRCAAVETQLIGVWDSATKDAIRMAFLETKKSYAADTWQRVVRAFDAYAAEWTQMRAEACEARWQSGTQPEEVFDLRMSCLSKRIGELGALVKVLARADAGVVQKAVRASSSLTGIAICADEEALRAPYPPPKDAEAKAKVAAIAEKLAEAEAFNKTGKYREGLEHAQKLEAEANAVDYRPVHAEVLYRLGELLYSSGEYKKAETTLYEAAHVAGESRDGLLAAKAMARLVWVVGYQQARHEEGLSLGRAAKVVLGLGGGDDDVRARLLNNLGVVFMEQGEYDKALEYYRKSLAIREKALGPDHPEVAHPLNNMGLVFSLQGEYDKALEYHRRALAIRKKALGPDHPDVVHSLNNIGLVFWEKGEYDKAHEYLRKALVIWEIALEPEHPHLAWSLSGMAHVLLDKGMPEEALQPLERAVSICEKKTCHSEPHGQALFGLARALVATNGDNERAIKLAEQAREVFGAAPNAFKQELEEVNAWLKERGAE